jgi:two-component system, LytTR family, response regulator
MKSSDLLSQRGAPSQIKAILVDDEEHLRDHLREQLEAFPEISIIGEAHDVQSALSLVLSMRVEVIFLDIKMPPDNGFNLLPLLAKADPMPEIIFVTAYEMYAIEAFENHALDYLTKPVHPERLAKTIERLKRILTDRSSHTHDQNDTSDGEPTPLKDMTEQSLVPLRDGSLFIMSSVAEICAIQAEGDYTRILIKDKAAMIVKHTINSWEARLPESIFPRLSRSLILNKKKVSKIVTLDRNHSEAHLTGIAPPLRISRLEMKRLREALCEE